MIADSVEIRVYNVGLGDCILLTFQSRTSSRSTKLIKQRVLVDFGSIGRNEDGPGLLDVAKQIVEDCRETNTRSKLDAVITTHRHRDHLAGFGGEAGEYLVENLTDAPKLILQPWTEDPAADDPVTSFRDMKPGAAKHLKSLSMSQQVTTEILKELRHRKRIQLGRRTDSEVEFYATKNVPFRETVSAKAGFDFDDPDVLNEEDLANQNAIHRLQNWKKGTNQPAFEYLSEGMKTTLGDGSFIENLVVDVLGPVGPDHWEKLDSKGSSDELWKKLSALTEDHKQPDAQTRGAKDEGEFVNFDKSNGPSGVLPIFKNEYRSPETEERKDNVRWLISKLDAIRGQQLLGFVRKLDEHINNTSLVLLFKFGKLNMLFPGDAEVASWEQISTTESDGSVLENKVVIEKLKKVNIYKVGHHGSNNATPKKSLWRHMTDTRADDDTLHCLLSTQSTRFKNAIPNKNLFKAMSKATNIELMTTDKTTGDDSKIKQPDGWVAAIDSTTDKVMSYAKTFKA